MENLCFVTMVVIVLVPHLTLSVSSTYSRPEKFYINCGSDSNVTYGGRTFVVDIISGGYSLKSGSSTVPGIYQTVRIFKRPSSYKFQLDYVGRHFLRLHFFAMPFRKELLTARFTVSVTCSGSSHHLKSFSLHNFNDTKQVEEFLLILDSREFEVQFVPDVRSSVAFVNAIEVFYAPPSDFTFPSVSDKNLYIVYRLNVGGEKITPEYDTLGRTWWLDDEYLYQKDSARNIQSIQEKPNYKSGSATKFTAPHFIYQTAKTMDRSAIGLAAIMINVTWSFKVKSNSRHLIRIHLCDVLNKSQEPFYLYVNGHWRIVVTLTDQLTLVIPFYIDVVNVSDGSGVLNVSLGTQDAYEESGFLNGLEVMEFLRDSGSSDHGSSSFRVYIIAGCVALFLVLGLLCIVFLKRKKKNNKSEVEVTMWSPLPLYRGGVSSSDERFLYPDNNSPSPLSDNLQLGLKIPLAEILRVTNNFEEQWLIGKGGFGDVYKAILPDGSKVAIKRGKTGSGQGILEFQTEIQVLSKIWHRNLVSLIGYCKEKSEMILVYEYMEKGTLKEHLYGGSDLPSLTWIQRLEICIGAARGLHYLHSGSEGGTIIHRDVKSTNILLDDNNIAKVADFGISKLVIPDHDLSTNIKGTFGYLDPEYVLTRILTEKSDVYAFGVVLLEVLCARPALDCCLPEEEMNLAEWAMVFFKSKGTIDEIVDPKLKGQIEPNCLKKFMEIAEKCVKDDGEERPSMADVMWDLDYVLKLQIMTIHREPHEDSAATISSDCSLVIPRFMVSDSFSSNSAIAHEDQAKNRFGSTDSSEIQVSQERDRRIPFTQKKITS